jgi:hypothetical protein
VPNLGCFKSALLFAIMIAEEELNGANVIVEGFRKG